MKRTDLFAPLNGSSKSRAHLQFKASISRFCASSFDFSKEEAARLEARNKEFEAENSDLRQQIDKFKRPSTTPRWGSAAANQRPNGTIIWQNSNA